MVSILIFCVIIGFAVILIGSISFQYLIPSGDSGMTPQEIKCQFLANEGYKMHLLYPESVPDDLPESDRDRLLKLDEQWMNECVSVLPTEKIFSIVNNVDRDVKYGE
ncbi:MAG: hypothetical protein ACW9WZ_03020 [Nitrosopumilus sp.]